MSSNKTFGIFKTHPSDETSSGLSRISSSVAKVAFGAGSIRVAMFSYSSARGEERKKEKKKRMKERKKKIPAASTKLSHRSTMPNFRRDFFRRVTTGFCPAVSESCLDLIRGRGSMTFPGVVRVKRRLIGERRARIFVSSPRFG